MWLPFLGEETGSRSNLPSHSASEWRAGMQMKGADKGTVWVGGRRAICPVPPIQPSLRDSEASPQAPRSRDHVHRELQAGGTPARTGGRRMEASAERQRAWRACFQEAKGLGQANTYSKTSGCSRCSSNKGTTLASIVISKTFHVGNFFLPRGNPNPHTLSSKKSW